MSALTFAFRLFSTLVTTRSYRVGMFHSNNWSYPQGPLYIGPGQFFYKGCIFVTHKALKESTTKTRTTSPFRCYLAVVVVGIVCYKCFQKGVYKPF